MGKDDRLHKAAVTTVRRVRGMFNTRKVRARIVRINNGPVTSYLRYGIYKGAKGYIFASSNIGRFIRGTGSTSNFIFTAPICFTRPDKHVFSFLSHTFCDDGNCRGFGFGPNTTITVTEENKAATSLSTLGGCFKVTRVPATNSAC